MWIEVQPTILLCSDIVKDMRIRMSLLVAGLRRLSSKEGRAAMLIGYMDIWIFMVYVQQI